MAKAKKEKGKGKKKLDRRTLGLQTKPLDLKKEAWEAYLEHLRQGFSEECFVYRIGKSYHDSVTYKTLNNMTESDPEIFPPEHRQSARAEGHKWFEEQGRKIMMGQVPGANAAVYQIMMRNKFGWDKPHAQLQISLEADFLKRIQVIETMPTIECEGTIRNDEMRIEHVSNDDGNVAESQ